MKGKINFFTSLLFFAAGIALIVLHQDKAIIATVVRLLGWTFIIPAAFNIIVGAFSHRSNPPATYERARRHAYVWGLVVSIFGVLLGIAMLVATDVFAAVMAYFFGILLIVAGVYHVLAVSYLARPFVLPAYFYIIPILMIAAGCVIIFAPTVQEAKAVVVLITGIGMVCSAVNSLLEYIGTHPSRHSEKVIEAEAVDTDDPEKTE